MDDEGRKECPMCASRNVSFAEREHSLVCRDCGTVIAGTPVKLELPREEAKEIVHEVPSKYKLMEKRIKEKAKKAKKKVSKKKVKKTKKQKKPSKKKIRKVKRKNFLKRLLRRR